MYNSNLGRLHAVLLEMALEFKRICEKHNLQYYLIGGTLLGAVRHQGFIPWDDDFDVGMPRPDYDKFIDICSSELDSRFYLHCIENDSKYWQRFAKIRKNGTEFNERSISKIDTHKGIFIDIFPIDNIPNDSGNLLKLQSYLISLLSSLIFRKRKLILGNKPGKVETVLIYFTAPFSIKQLSVFQQYVMKYYKNYQTKYWISFGSHYSYEKEAMNKELYMPHIELPFEGFLFRAPENYDYVLSRLFGDYMKLPPLNQRISKHYTEIDFNIN